MVAEGCQKKNKKIYNNKKKMKILTWPKVAKKKKKKIFLKKTKQ